MFENRCFGVSFGEGGYFVTFSGIHIYQFFSPGSCGNGSGRQHWVTICTLPPPFFLLLLFKSQPFTLSAKQFHFAASILWDVFPKTSSFVGYTVCCRGKLCTRTHQLGVDMNADGLFPQSSSTTQWTTWFKAFPPKLHHLWVHCCGVYCRVHCCGVYCRVHCCGVYCSIHCCGVYCRVQPCGVYCRVPCCGVYCRVQPCGVYCRVHCCGGILQETLLWGYTEGYTVVGVYCWVHCCGGILLGTLLWGYTIGYTVVGYTAGYTVVGVYCRVHCCGVYWRVHCCGVYCRVHCCGGILQGTLLWGILQGTLLWGYTAGYTVVGVYCTQQQTTHHLELDLDADGLFLQSSRAGHECSPHAANTTQWRWPFHASDGTADYATHWTFDAAKQLTQRRALEKKVRGKKSFLCNMGDSC